ncbi:MAG: hypothetical protein H0V41_00320 [Pseudonocardiales bacterium]|nr:hypothetical protein [Pseudonocardiales bacterium]
MRAGDTLRGYRLLEDFRVVGAGLSEWTFAERGGRAYFIKRFLAPTYPDDAAPGSAKTKARKRGRRRGPPGARRATSQSRPRVARQADRQA